MKLSEVRGHGEIIARLRRAVVSGQLSGALLLAGPEGVGKRALADALAACALCLNPGGGDACGECACCRLLLAGRVHPDLAVVVREENRREVRVEQVRELGRTLHLHPLLARRRVAIIDDAHLLSVAAQNALLKTLEEPPGNALLVLVAAGAAALLPTVRSRCRRFDCAPLEPATVRELLRERFGVPPERASLLAAYSEGSVGRALALHGEGLAAARGELMGLLARLPAASFAELSRAAHSLGRGDVDMEALLAVPLTWYRDLLELVVRGRNIRLRNEDARPALEELAATTSPQCALRLLATVCDTLAALRRSANRQLALETMFLSLRRAGAGAG